MTEFQRRGRGRSRLVLSAATALAGIAALSLAALLMTGRWSDFPGLRLPGLRVEETASGERVIWAGEQVGRTPDGSAFAPYPERPFRSAQCDLRARGEETPAPGTWSAPAVGASAPVLSETTGEFRLPDAPFGARVPGSASLGDSSGTVLEAGHVDDVRGNLSPWGRLARLKACDRLYRTDASGVTREFVVTDLYAVPQERLVGEPIFSRDGPHRLALVTCAGRFVSASGSTLGFSFSENLVVMARPARAA